MLQHVLDRAIRTTPDNGVTPGGVLAYGDQGAHIATIPFGRSHVVGTSVPVFDVSTDTIYDLASLTKPIATAAALMKLDVDVHEPVKRLVPELMGRGSEQVTFAHLLGHASGFPAHERYDQRLHAGGLAGAPGARDALLRMVCATATERPPGEAAIYSDLGYIVLGFAIERLVGERLDEVTRRLITEPLGMCCTGFVDLHGPPGLPAKPVQVTHPDVQLGQAAAQGARPAHAAAPPLFERGPIAPTEVCPVRGLIHAAVHDENAHAAGGITGHAGLFGTADDVARFARMLIAVSAGRTVCGFSPDAVRRFFFTSAAPGTTWRLGWDRPSPLPARSHAGDAWPRSGLGHLGFTGCSLWLDLDQGRYVVLLTNRVHPRRDLASIAELRRAVMDAVVHLLDSGAARR